MALNDSNYTRTGNSWLASLANRLSYVPFTGPITGTLLALDGAFSAIGWLFRGKLLSAATALGTGVASGAIAAQNSIGNPLMPVYWVANLASGITTGHTVQKHGVAAVEAATSFVTKPLGVQPTVLRAYYAGVGSAGAQVAPAGPGRWASGVANERGQDANAMYQNYMRGEGGVHVNELNSANGRGA